ncbi:MAG: hypothetical protein LBD05_00580, partial [Mycoplasmataceae bacterium]|nr:hypothetical protein [Mycoplasmataceae bacterium]
MQNEDNAKKKITVNIVKSTCEEINPLPEGKEIVVNKLFADKNNINMHVEKIKKMFPNDTEKDISMKIQNIVIKDNVFNSAMNEIEKCFKFVLDEE